MNQLVLNQNGKLVTTSRKVAEAFRKQHAHILRSIQNIECSEEFTSILIIKEKEDLSTLIN